jgi:hypothetical protein
VVGVRRLLAVVGAGSADVPFHYRHLADKMASHYDDASRADG